jgi:6-pyruvoyltetrahydropterin/6-carboxytetrahydropterin synthase
MQPATCELSQHFYFDAAHTLERTIETVPSLRVHGHTYDAEVTVSGSPDVRSGMVVDLGHLRHEIDRVRLMLDHHLLDEVAGLGPATLENLCSFIYRHLIEAVPSLVAVMVERRANGNRCVMRWTP